MAAGRQTALKRYEAGRGNAARLLFRLDSSRATKVEPDSSENDLRSAPRSSRHALRGPGCHFGAHRRCKIDPIKSLTRSMFGDNAFHRRLRHLQEIQDDQLPGKTS